MNELRVIVASAVFGLGSYLVYDLAVNGFNWIELVACLFCYLAAHCMWPHADVEERHWHDILEVLVDLQYRAIAMFLRSIGKVVRSKDGGIDIDL